MHDRLIVLAGATGALGGRIARELLERDTPVRAVVRHNSAPDKSAELKRLGATVVEVDFHSGAELSAACAGASCVVSALSGLGDVIIDAQTKLLDAAVVSGVQRFIPSDFSIDFTKLPPALNRNLDLRREFHERLSKAKISATSILNGMFTDLLTGPAPVILFRIRRVVYWEDADQLLDFTTIDDVARYTALAAMDQNSPRFLRIAGDQISARGLVDAANEATGKNFSLIRGGGLGRLSALIRIMRAVSPQKGKLYPPWQGMQYLHNMFDGRAKLVPLDNDRYPGMRWTTVTEYLAAHYLSGRPS